MDRFEDLQLLTADETASLLHVSVGHLRNLKRRGLLGAVHVGRCVRYRRTEVEAYLRSAGGAGRRCKEVENI